jgi:acyl-CoA synthetase (AMP-forming)/AMP-acid ligase II
MKLPEPFSSLGEAVEQIGAAHPEDPALRHAGVTLTRGELAERARSIAAGWHATGLQPGDVVGIAGEGGPAFALALLSASRAGLVPLLLDPRTTSEEARAVFTRAQPKALATCGPTAFAPDPGLPRYDFDAAGCAALAGASRTELPPPAPSDAAALLLVTSGTSGRPAVVALSASFSRSFPSRTPSSSPPGSWGRSCVAPPWSTPARAIPTGCWPPRATSG